MLNAVQIPKQTSGRCTITEANYWTLYNYLKLLNDVAINWTQYNYLDNLLNAVQLPKRITERYNYLKNYWTLCNYLNKLLNAVQLPTQTTERCTITEANYWTQYNVPKQTTERCAIT